jgi:hypothetical protein
MFYTKLFCIATFILTTECLVSCATYVSKPPLDAARIKFSSENCNGCTAFIDEKNTCWPDTSIRIASKDHEGIYVGTGKRIWISWLTVGGYPVTTMCKVAMSFIPEPNVTYVSEFKRGPICSLSTMTVYQLDATGKKSIEPTSSQQDDKGICDL